MQSTNPPIGTRKNFPRLFFAFRGCATLSSMPLRLSIKSHKYNSCRWVCAKHKSPYRHSQKLPAAYSPQCFFGTLRGPRVPLTSVWSEQLVPVGLRKAQIPLSALAKTSRGFSLHFAAAPDFPPRSPTFARAQVTASAKTPLGDEMQRTAAWGCSFSLVPVVGLEPTRILLHRILSPARLPISPHRRK